MRVYPIHPIYAHSDTITSTPILQADRLKLREDSWVVRDVLSQWLGLEGYKRAVVCGTGLVKAAPGLLSPTYSNRKEKG